MVYVTQFVKRGLHLGSVRLSYTKWISSRPTYTSWLVQSWDCPKLYIRGQLVMPQRYDIAGRSENGTLGENPGCPWRPPFGPGKVLLEDGFLRFSTLPLHFRARLPLSGAVPNAASTSPVIGLPVDGRASIGSVMHRDNPAKCGQVTDFSPRTFGPRLRDRLPSLARTAIVIASFMFAGGSILWASTAGTPANLTVQRSTRAIPRRYAIHPNGATVTVNQSQRFDVTDADGNVVPVRWNVSGLGCSGATCGTIDDHGVYRTPSSLPHPRVVILEGVLIDNPKYSVLTEIRLEATNAGNGNVVNASSARPSTAKPLQLEPPSLSRQNMARRVDPLPLPRAVAAAPASGDLTSSHRSEVTIPEHIIAAAPSVEPSSVHRSTASAPSQKVVAAAPSVEKLELARNIEPPPMPHPVAAAPVVQDSNRTSRVAAPPAQIVGAAPTAEKLNLGRKAETMPLPAAVPATPTVLAVNHAQRVERPAAEIIRAAPEAEKWDVARKVEPAPLTRPVGAAPGLQGLNRTARSEHPLPQQVIPAAPDAAKLDGARKIEPTPLPQAVAAAPAVRSLNSLPRSENPLPQQIIPAAPATEKWKMARNIEPPPSPQVVAAAPSASELKDSARAEHPLPQQVVGAAPKIEKMDVARKIDAPSTNVVAAAPEARSLNRVPRAEEPLPQQVVAAAPAVQKWEVARNIEPAPRPQPVSAAPVAREINTTPRVGVSLPSTAVAAAPAPENLTVARTFVMPPVVASAQMPRPMAAASKTSVSASVLLPLAVDVAPATEAAAAVPTTHAPVVIYRDGQLTINVENSTLADVLKLVAEKTGAVIDLPPGSGQDRIVEHAGPGPANNVLSQLLNGTHLNFIIVNSPQKPYAPTQVLLSVQRTDTESAAPASQAQVSSVYSPPPPSPAAQIMPPQYDPTLKAPEGQLSPEDLGELMKAKAKELLQKAQDEDGSH